MNNTRTLGIAAILIAATLVVGTFAVTTTTIATTQTAFAFSKNKKGEENSRNGNTITALKCQNKGSASGFDTAVDQECENLICTHPGENATCVQEGIGALTTNATSTPKTPKTCEECITTFLTPQQIAALPPGGIARLCENLVAGISEDFFRNTFLPRIGVSETTADDLIACLKNAGITFTTPG
jgi:hypothetical protein